ncbi:Hsp20/alpha crystallin family protein [Kribbella sp. NBC_01510]|uniref:Hsp20/alpha crystallin family protein n=1 Tax=Kribbella sp. NBC_01510 TaxID=2903581 RepID=UPI0038653A83
MRTDPCRDLDRLTQQLQRCLVARDMVEAEPDADRITAEYENGVLTVKIPVAAQAKPRKISISGGDSEPRQINA